jgi:hypothetical protein
MSHNIDIDSSNGLLATDIGLIAVNEAHAVFSIRIERAKLAEYHFFLNVISDVAGGDDWMQLPPRALPAPPLATKGRRGAAAAWGWVRWITRRRAGSAASKLA